MGHPQIQTRYTAAEYFAPGARNEVQHEYFDGEIFAMAGGTKSHNLTAQNFTLALRASMRGKAGQVFLGAVRLAVQEDFHCTYPDVGVTCDPTDRRNFCLIRRPVLIVEVLSLATVHTVLSSPADVLEIADLGLRLVLADVSENTDVAPLSLATPPEFPI